MKRMRLAPLSLLLATRGLKSQPARIDFITFGPRVSGGDIT